MLALCCLSSGGGGPARFLRAAVDGEFWFLSSERKRKRCVCCSENRYSISHVISPRDSCLFFLLKMGFLGEFLKDALIFEVTYCHIDILKPNNLWIFDLCQN